AGRRTPEPCGRLRATSSWGLLRRGGWYCASLPSFDERKRTLRGGRNYDGTVVRAVQFRQPRHRKHAAGRRPGRCGTGADAGSGSGGGTVDAGSGTGGTVDAGSGTGGGTVDAGSGTGGMADAGSGTGG